VFVSSVVMSFGGRFFEIMCCVTPEGELEMVRLALYDGDSRTTSNPNFNGIYKLNPRSEVSKLSSALRIPRKKATQQPATVGPGLKSPFSISLTGNLFEPAEMSIAISKAERSV